MSFLVISRAVEEDLKEIYLYLAEDNPRFAARLIERLLAAFRSVAEVPGRRHLREDLTTHPVRFLTVDSYLIVYRIDGDRVRMLRVLHGHRDISDLLEELTEE